MYAHQLVKGKKYGIPGSTNTFTFDGDYSPNKECFTRQDGRKHFGREFIEYKNGRPYLDLFEVK